MSQVKSEAERFPTWSDVRATIFIAIVAIFLAAVGQVAGHDSDYFTIDVAVLLLATLRPWEAW
jgi:hypothetical protein